MKKKLVKAQSEQIEQAIKALQQGGVIAYPTEAVYGLGCDPLNESAIKKILKVKQRDKEKGLILIAANFEQVKPFLQDLGKDIEKKIMSCWIDSKNPITCIIPFKNSTTTLLAVRVTKHPVVKELCEKFNSAIVSTSANLSKQEPARNSQQVFQFFENEIDFIVEGETDLNAQPSEIRDALTNKIIRPAN